jgi:hypothetical protein
LLLVIAQQGEMLEKVYHHLKESSAGFAALAVVVAGAIGYLCSLIHHTLFWLPCGYGIDHTQFVRAAVDNQWLTVKTARAQAPVKSEDITRKMAWDVVTLLWYRPGGTNNTQDPALGKALVSRSDAVSDVMHGLGTSVIASVLLIPAWMALSFWSLCLHCSWHNPSVLIVAGLLIWLHVSNYRRVRDRLSKLVQNALATYLAREYPKLNLIIVMKDSAQPNSGVRSCTATQSSNHRSNWWGAWKVFDYLRSPSLRPGAMHSTRDGC